MPDQNTQAAEATSVVSNEATKVDAVAEIIQKINESKYILVALSGGPSIDELSAAIGLTSYLNKLGKRATAIYSGGIPEALSFLEANNSFDNSADVLQDFVISLNKDKADHLRYKPDGDDVKIYITPYKNKISSDDLSYSYGDFNVDLVIALNVVSGIDLDDALREYGRIMQDASVVNITSGKPGKLGDIEWSNPDASSISEMTAHLLHEMNNELSLNANEATAFFAGIVSATNRFSTASTTPFTLTVASWLMECGANQQIVAENITADVDNRLYSVSSEKKARTEKKEEASLDAGLSDESNEATIDDQEMEANVVEEPSETEEALADLKEIQDELNGEEDLTVAQPTEAPVEVAPVVEEPVAAEAAPVVEEVPGPAAEPVAAEPVAAPVAEPVVEPVAEPADETSNANEDGYIASSKETVIAVPESFNPEAPSVEDNSKFSKMLEDALTGGSNPAVVNAPSVTAQPEINGVPEINFAPAADVEILPPPPAPTVIPGMPPMQATPQPTPVAQPVQPSQAQMPATDQTVSQMAIPTPTPEPLIQSRPPVQLVPQPTAGDNPGIADPGAFRIPGM